MRLFFIGVLAMTAFAVSAKAGNDIAEKEFRVTGPHVHDNLALYFIHGKSAPGEVPLTLDEALKLERVRVLETGDVNELRIENIGDQPVFIQSGDIVKGGRQDRVITSSFILKAKSGAVPLAAFCVEQGRWSSRGSESVAAFASSAEAMPSRYAKMSLREAQKSFDPLRSDARRRREAVSDSQSEVWREVAAKQEQLSRNLKEEVAAAQSESSLQLSLENEKLQQARESYTGALEKEGLSDDGIIGYAFAVNGKINSADVYGSNGLFRKMWGKQLNAAATEAMGEKGQQTGSAAPSPDAVLAFLKDAKAAASSATTDQAANRIDVRDGERAVYMSASMPGAGLVHENYLAK